MNTPDDNHEHINNPDHPDFKEPDEDRLLKPVRFNGKTYPTLETLTEAHREAREDEQN